MAKTITVPEGYEALADVLERALQQSASGKGKERHALGNERFEDQFIVRRGLRAGNAGFAVGQAMKKLDEGERMETARAVHEFLGAIVYAAGAIVTMETLDRQVTEEAAIMEIAESVDLSSPFPLKHESMPCVLPAPPYGSDFDLGFPRPCRLCESMGPCRCGVTK